MDLIAGVFGESPQPEGVIEDRSPADLSVVLGTHPHSTVQIERAVSAARAALPAWSRRSLEERVQLVRAIGATAKKHEEALAKAIALGMGKPLWEARTEVAAVVNKAAVTVDEGLKLVQGFSPPGTAPASGPDDLAAPAFECRFRPLGVLGVLGPFNFPAHLPNGHVLPALACGNTVVMKPSEVCPGVAELYARILHEAGVPPGVFNLVQGGGREGAALAGHPDVNGVLFTGSWDVGLAIERQNLGHTRLLALEMGGKNAALILDDADLDKALWDVCFSAFVSAGQRCTATSRAIVVGSSARADEFARRAAQLARSLTVGFSLDDVFMGPLASEAALRKFENGCQAARDGGRTLHQAAPVSERRAPRAQIEEVLASTRVEPKGLRGCYATPAVHRIHVRAHTPYERDELFGPDLAVLHAASLEEAAAIANETDYGLAASVHTKSAPAFEAACSLLECGIVNLNAPTVGASGRLPFGGTRRSGNHRPAGLTSTLYCTYPVAMMRGAPTLEGTKFPPGVTWQR
ncbi:MAG: aldehyde dehydrogenase family protein [Deltaproteobacteria bacterium]|nr:aldehyde dehydrogenase family protein [Deltaproteobacteria bacterium]